MADLDKARSAIPSIQAARPIDQGIQAAHEGLRAKIAAADNATAIHRAAALRQMRALEDLPRIAPVPIPRQGASLVYDKIRERIQQAERSKGADEQILVQCSIAGDGPFVVMGLGYIGDELFVVHGVDAAGNKSEVIGHPSAIQFVIRTMKSDGKPYRPIGFHYEP